MQSNSDIFSQAVIQSGLEAAADEMFAVLKKTAMSPIIYEVLDVGTGVTDASGNLLSSGAGIPTFVGVLDKAVKRLVELYAQGAIRPGDIFVTNDPYYGGVTHLSDVVVAMPVFADDHLVAWTASIAHWNDIGGITPGSMSVKATEIFQEGLRLPAIRLFDGGKAIDAVFDIIAANSRQPEFTRGDLWAQVAASRKAAERIEQLVKAYGIDLFDDAVNTAFEQGRRKALAGLAALPKGCFEISEEQDDGAIWQARIEISNERFLVDLSGNPSQLAAPYNTSRDGAVISAQMIFKAICDPDLMTNAGTFTALDVITEPGTAFDAKEPAPHGFYFETRIRLYDMLWRCLAEAMPERLPAGHFGSICGTVLAGHHPDTGRRFTMVEPQMGGWGATNQRDGLNAMYSASHGETFNCPVEICEARYGIDVAWRRMNGKDRGEGLNKGGHGLEICYRPHGQVTLSAGYSRNKKPVWGLGGGEPGGTNGIAVHRSDGEVEAFSFVSDVKVEPGDEILISTADGGCWGKADSA